MLFNNHTVIALCTEYSIRAFGGTEVLVATLIRELSEKCKIVLVSNDEAETIMASEFSSRLAAHIPWRPESASWASGRELARQLREQHVDLAHFHSGGTYGWGIRVPGASPITAAANLGIPCISTIHTAVSIFDGYCGAQKPFWFKLALFPGAWLGKISALAKLSAEITVSKYDLQHVRRRYWPLRSRFRHIYHSRLESATGGESLREQTILCVGHIAFRKGQDLLARAFAKIATRFPNWKLLFIGNVAERDCGTEIEELAAHFPDQISMLGQRGDILCHMQKAAIFVQPSFFEGLLLALHEAMASGCACIASRIGGNTELIEHEKTGLLSLVGDVDALASDLERLMTDAALRDSFRNAAPAAIIAKGMTAQKMFEKHATLYESILRHV
jgi:glycosyltransferase involved in cell wall biosynthesis